MVFLLYVHNIVILVSAYIWQALAGESKPAIGIVTLLYSQDGCGARHWKTSPSTDRKHL